MLALRWCVSRTMASRWQEQERRTGRCFLINTDSRPAHNHAANTDELCQPWAFTGVIVLKPAVFTEFPGLRVIRSGTAFKWQAGDPGRLVVDEAVNGQRFTH